MSAIEFSRQLDATGLKCPLPILRAKKALAEMQSGEVLRILATDLNAAQDFAAFSKQTGNTLLFSHEAEGRFEFLLQKK
ncbi:MAG: sulfurtransferase TusA family protein [Betaproteobacteria bacterium]|nr:sulfurtransferase TusA family protein [Betaproteobacteria bacterium]